MAVSSGDVFYSWREAGIWTSRVVLGAASRASLDLTEDDVPYLAYSSAAGDGDSRYEIVLARITSGGLSNSVLLLDGVDTTYKCGSHDAGEHHDYQCPVLRCASNVFHVAACHLRDRDSYYDPEGPFCMAVHDERMAYCRYQSGLLEQTFSGWSYYHDTFVREGNLCAMKDGTVRLTFTDGPGAFYSESLIPWSAEYLWALRAPAVDASLAGSVAVATVHGGSEGIHLKFRRSGAFDPDYKVKDVDPGNDADLCMEYLALVYVAESGPGTNDLFLLVQLDGDDDGIDDAWELKHHGGPTNATPTADGDSDGCSEYEEFMARTNPTNPGSWFGFAGVEIRSPAECQLSWQGHGDRLYTVFADGAVTGGFSSELGVISLEADAIVTVTNTDPLTEPQRFYRLGVSRP